MAGNYKDRTIAEWMLTEDPKEQEAIAIDIAGRLDLGVYDIVQIIQELRPYITEGASLPDTAKALRIVVTILNAMQIPLSRINVHTLVEYFCARLENIEQSLNNRAGIKESAEALFTLINVGEGKRFPPGDAVDVAKAIFTLSSNDILRDQKLPTRVALLRLLELLMESYKSHLLKDLGNEKFVQGVVSMAAFEKDPNCLRVLFGMFEDLSRNWKLTEDECNPIFQSFSRYYPISLKEAINKDPAVPTPEELKLLLLNCFTSNDFYAKEAFGRLIDMLDANHDLSANSKKDVFDTMSACVSTYGLPVICQWAPKIWDSLKFEVWNGENEDFIKGSLKVIHTMVTIMSNRNWDWDDQSNEAAKNIISMTKECKERIIDTNQRYVPKTGLILDAIASASPYSFQWVLKTTLPALLTLWDGTSARGEKTPILDVLNRILHARVEVGAKLEAASRNVDSQDEEPILYLRKCISTISTCLDTFKDRIVEGVYWSAMTENLSDSESDTAFRVSTIRGLTCLMGIPNLLFDFESGTIISTLNKIAMDSTQLLQLHEVAVHSLRQISIQDPTRFGAITLPNFMAHLPESFEDSRQRDVEKDRIIHILDSLVEIACTATCSGDGSSKDGANPAHAVFDQFQESMLTKLFDVLKHKEQLPYAALFLAAISRGLELFDDVLNNVGTQIKLPVQALDFRYAQDPSHHPYGWIVLRLYKQLAVIKDVHDYEAGEGIPYVGLNLKMDEDMGIMDEFVRLVGDIATKALRSAQTTYLNNFVNAEGSSAPSHIWSLFVDNCPESVDSTQMNLKDAPVDKGLANILSMSLVAGMNRTDQNRLRINVGTTSFALMENVTEPNKVLSPYSRISQLCFLQLLVNKFGAAAEVLPDGDTTLADAMEKLGMRFLTDSGDRISSQVFQAVSYFAAASLARCDKSDKPLVELMVSGLSHKKLGKKIAQSFRTLLSPSHIMNKENFCHIRPLRQGHLYNFSINAILTMWQRTQDHSTRTNCLIALAATIHSMDTNVYLDAVPQILPLILEGTNVHNDDPTKIFCINIIARLIPLVPTLITTHLDSIISRMVSRTRNTYYSPSDANVECRAAAIDVLALLVEHVGKTQVLKRKARVLSELDVAVDDCSVVVRERAVRCRLAWFNLRDSEE